VGQAIASLQPGMSNAAAITVNRRTVFLIPSTPSFVGRKKKGARLPPSFGSGNDRSISSQTRGRIGKAAHLQGRSRVVEPGRSGVGRAAAARDGLDDLYLFVVLFREVADEDQGLVAGASLRSSGDG
jgi:hypothetical protein